MRNEGRQAVAEKLREASRIAVVAHLNPDGDWDGLNAEILDMFRDFKVSTEGKMKIRFVTESYFNQ